MSANLHLPHLQVLVEDDANRQIVLGFLNHHDVNSRQMPIGRTSGGWLPTLEQFRDEEIPRLRRHRCRHVLIVIDFDLQTERLTRALTYIPEDLRDRVYVIGCNDEPESLTRDLRCSKETVGGLLATDCANETRTTWDHPMLKHNARELDRLWSNVRPFLMQP